MVRKAQQLLRDLLKTRDSVKELECSHLYEPSSECIYLQWTLRFEIGVSNAILLSIKVGNFSHSIESIVFIQINFYLVV